MSDLPPAASKLLGKLSSPHALTWGGVFVRYDSPEEAAYHDLRMAGVAEVFSIHAYGLKVRLTQAGLAALAETQP